MKSNPILLLVFLCGYLTTALSQPLSDEDFYEEIPFEYIKGKIGIPVNINGIKYSFLLDTGGIFQISNELQALFQFEVTGQATVVDINKKSVALDRVKVPSLKIGDLQVEDRIAIVGELYSQYPTSCFDFAGMIGRDFFEGAILHIDYEYKKIILTNQKEKLSLQEDQSSPMQFTPGGLPLIEVSLNGQTAEYMVFDSGAKDLFSYKRKIAKDLKQAEKLEFKGLFSFGVSMEIPKPKIQYRVKMDSISFAGTTFRDFYSDLSKESRSRLGSKIIEYGKVTIDYQEKRFYFESFPHIKVVNSFTSFGFSVMKYQDRYVIKNVLIGSIADEAGLKQGQIVYKINDQIMVNIEDECEVYINGYDYELDQEITMELIDKKGKKKTLQFSKMSY